MVPAVNYTSLLLSLVVILLVNIDTFDYLIWRNKATNIMREQGVFYSKRTNKAVYIMRTVVYALAFAYLAVFLGLIVWIMFYEMFNGGLML